MIIQVDTDEGYVMVAGHQLLGSGLTWLTFNPSNPMMHQKLGSNNLTDGRVNMPKLLAHNSEAAEYCANLTGGQWYLPARNELALMTPNVINKVPGLDMSGNDESAHLWTSTQNGNGFFVDQKNNAPRVEAMTRKNDSGSIGRKYVYECTPNEGSGYQCSYVRRYQVLCFRRLPI